MSVDLLDRICGVYAPDTREVRDAIEAILNEARQEGARLEFRFIISVSLSSIVLGIVVGLVLGVIL